MKKIFGFILISCLSASVILTSCKKDKEPTPAVKSDAENAEDFAALESDFNSIDQAISDGNSGGSNARLSGLCFSINFKADTGSAVPGFSDNYIKYTLNFSGGDCDSIERKGEIVVYQSGSFLTGNYKDSVVFNGYSTFGREITGYRVFKMNAALSNITTLVVDVKFNVQAKFANGKSIYWNAERQKSFVNYWTPMFSYLEVRGKGSCITLDGEELSQEILEPLVLTVNCGPGQRFATKGKVKFENKTRNTSATIDYGVGTCDKVATVTTGNGNHVVIVLK